MKKIFYPTILSILLLAFATANVFAAVTLTSNASPAITVNQGITGQLVYIVKMDVATTDATVNSVQFTLGGTHDANDLSVVRVYFNATNPTVAGGTQLNAVAAAFAAPHAYTINVNRPVAAGTSGYFIIVVDVTNTATDNHTVVLNGETNPVVFGFTTSQTVTNSQTNIAGAVSIEAADISLASAAVPSAEVNQGTSGQTVYVAQMTVAVQPVTVNSIQFTLSGTHDANDLTVVRVYFNANNPTSAGGTQLNAVSAAIAAPHTYTVNVNRPMAAGSSGYFIVLVDVNNTATDNSTVKVDGAANPVSFGYITAPNITNAQTDIAGLLTIQAADIVVSSEAVPAAEVNQGTTGQTVYISKMEVANQPLTVNSIQFTLGGTHDANDLTVVRVYFNANNPTSAGGTQLNAVSAAIAAPHTYTVNVNRPMAVGSSGYFIVLVDVNNTATDNSTVKVNGATNPVSFGFTTAPNVTNTQTDIAGLLTIQAADIVVSAEAVPAAEVNQGTTGQTVYISKMAVATQPLTVSSIQFTLEGTHDANDLTVVRVYFNANDPTAGGGTQLNAVSAAVAAPHTYTVNINRPMAIGSSGYFIIVVDINNTATDNNTVKVNGATNPVSFGFTTAPNVTNTQTDVAETLTIQAADVTLTTAPITESAIVAGQNNHIVEIVRMQVETEPVTVSSMQFQLSGTHDANDLSVVRIYFNATAPNLTGATQLNAVSAAFAAPHTYTVNVNRPMAVGSSGYFIILVDVKPTATTGHTVTLDGAANPVVFGFITAPNIANNQTTNGDGTVPVTLISFNAVLGNNGAVAQWSTATEQNNDYFIVEYSTDGIHFNAIGKVQGKGNSVAQTSYTFLHTGVAAGINYYRLKQVDADGQTAYSTIARLELKVSGAGFSAIYPNPVRSKLSFSIKVDKQQPLSVKVVGLNGTILQTKTLAATTGMFTGQIDMQGYANGVYFLQLADNEGRILEAKKIAVLH